MAVENNEQQPETPEAISKSQLKKLRRHQRWIEGKDERKRIEKEKRKLRRQALAKLRDEEGLESCNSRRKITLMEDSENKFSVVIDLDFEEFMTENEIGKSVKQVGRIYATNRRSQNPCQLYIASLKGNIRDRFAVTNRGFESWDINYTELDYIELFRERNGEQFDKSQFIYLTGDSDETLPDVATLLKDYEARVFVIGGLVDHNRHKRLCYERAKELGIPTARLPIEDHVKLSQRRILSTVTVFEILLEIFGSRKSWREALTSAIPKRKIADVDPTTDEDCKND